MITRSRTRPIPVGSDLFAESGLLLPQLGNIPGDTDHAILPADLHLTPGDLERQGASVLCIDMRPEAADFTPFP
jgi:hypothetical protein